MIKPVTQFFCFVLHAKTKLNEKLNRTHFECTELWNTLYNCIQTSIEYKLQSMNEAWYDRLNKKTRVQHIQSQLEHKVPDPGAYFT